MNAEIQRQALGICTGVVAQYAGSDASKASVNLIDALLLAYSSDLETVKPEGLAKLQGQVAQLRALRDVFTSVPHADPRI